MSKGIPFARAFTLQSSKRNCPPPADLVFLRLILPRVFFSGGVSIFDRLRYSYQLLLGWAPGIIFDLVASDCPNANKLQCLFGVEGPASYIVNATHATFGVMLSTQHDARYKHTILLIIVRCTGFASHNNELHTRPSSYRPNGLTSTRTCPAPSARLRPSRLTDRRRSPGERRDPELRRTDRAGLPSDPNKKRWGAAGRIVRGN